MKKIILISVFAFLVSSAFAQLQDTLFIYKAGIPVNKFGFNQIDTITFKSVSGIDSIFFYKNDIVIFKENLTKVDSLNRYDRFGKVKDIDGNVYRTIKIGDRIWMAENLKVTTLKDGTHIAEVTDQTSWGALTTPAMCWYNNDKASSFPRNGGLYNWFTVDTKKLCPTGWHVPSQIEYDQMTDDAGSVGNLKVPGTEWTAPNTDATNQSGFSLYPSGYRNSARFEDIFNYATFAGLWMSNQYSLATGKILYVNQSPYIPISFPYEYKEEGHAIRCVKNTVPSISMGNVSKTYGDANFMLSALSTITGTVFTYEVDSGTAATIYSNGFVSISSVGKVKVKITSSATSIYDENSFFAYLFIAPKTLTIKVNNQSKLVGQPNSPYNSIWPSGFVLGEGAFSSDGSVFGEYLTFSTNATTNSPVGLYQIVASGISPNPNYTYVFVNGVLSINNPGPIPYAPVKDVEGNTYKTVVYGSQIWMVENLRTHTLRDGTQLPYTKNATTYSSYTATKTPAVSWYNNDSINNYPVNGGLYNWYAVNTKQLCPVGWHVPTSENWDVLAGYLAPGVIGGKMKSMDTSAWNAPNADATNSSMFNAVGAGKRTSTGVYYFLKSYTDWWTSSESLYGAYYTELTASNSGYSKPSTSALNTGHSVRCMKNDTTFKVENFKDTIVNYGHLSYYGLEGLFLSATSNMPSSPVYSVVSGECVSISSPTSGIVKIVKAGTAQVMVTFPATADYQAFSKTITITVLKKTITLKPNYALKIQGTPNPIFSIDGTAFSYGDNISKIDVLPTITTTATVSSPVGKYPISLSVGSDDCYEFQFLKDTLEVLSNSNALKDIQGNVYRTVLIGSQTWMADNLKTTRLNDNTLISNSTTYWSSTTLPSYCWYNNDSISNSNLGSLYNFYSVQTNKLCPTGWHVPTDADWTQLENFLIANGFNYDGTLVDNKIAKSLSSSKLTDWLYLNPYVGTVTNNVSLNNKARFNATPAGYRNIYGTYGAIDNTIGFWTSTTYDSTRAWNRTWGTQSYQTDKYNSDFKYGYSVRCIKD